MYGRVDNTIKLIQENCQRHLSRQQLHYIIYVVGSNIFYVDQILRSASDYSSIVAVRPKANVRDPRFNNYSSKYLPPNRSKVVPTLAVDFNGHLPSLPCGSCIGTDGSERRLAHAALTVYDSMLARFCKSVSDTDQLFQTSSKKISTPDWGGRAKSLLYPCATLIERTNFGDSHKSWGFHVITDHI